MSAHRDDAVRQLAGPGRPIHDADVPAKPGLYALHAAADTWRVLGLGAPPDDRPLYVGKAEDSLSSRDVKTHFGTGKTGSSTVRRTLAGLLAIPLDLHGRPRNPMKPAHFANYGLEAVGDQRLTDWMVEHLRIAVWPSSDGVVLDQVETEVLQALVPPLNIDKVQTPWRAVVKAGRSRLAAEARSWAT